MFCAIFSNSSHLGIPNCKKIQRIHTTNILAQRRINFNQWVLRYCHFRVYAIFSNSPWRPSWIVNLHKYEIVSFRDTIVIKPGRVAQSVGHLTRKSGALGSIPGLATYFRFSFRFFKKGSCQLLAKVCARSTG